ncbi:MAG: plasmid partitioning protein ParB [Cereibacter sp.]|jgi:ParB family chromosome partitioning protein|nr:plasmid partitioning protein ParB [Cereibacter sp.]
MGRKILDKLSLAQADKPAAASPARRMGSAMSVGGLRDGLERITSNSVRDLDPSLIDQDGLRDRLQFDAEDIADLAASIRAHGQQVPILVRPSNQPGRFRVIYGRRRLAAIRQIGGPVKAIVRTLDDKAAVLAQGQENNLRLDPSFIEKAVFIGAMRDAGYDGTVIREALGVSKQSVSSYVVVLDAIPLPVIEAIGAAHDTGRRKWTELADLARVEGVDLPALLGRMGGALQAAESSAARFEAFLNAAKAVASGDAAPQQADAAAQHDPVHRGGPRPLRLADGRRIATVKRSASGLEVKVSQKEAPEFSTWLATNLDGLIQELHGRWLEESGSND